MIADKTPRHQIDREPARVFLSLFAIVAWAATCGAAVMAGQYWFAVALVFTAAPVVMAWQLDRPRAASDDSVVTHSVSLRKALEPVNAKPVPREPSRAAQ